MSGEKCGYKVEEKVSPSILCFYVQALAANGVAVVGPVFINDYLVSETRPKVEDCLAEEFKPFWKARR